MMPGNGSSSVGVLTDHPSFIRCVVFHHVTGHPQLVCDLEMDIYFFEYSKKIN
ncbi:hypothetical protein HanIR_Chr03g0100261 [Helianthus annuus]|nr:hypothetical protein HanIR_Chr03g0100261 [Helianthus annuus]